jgi:prolyl 4-hydroxylase
MSQSVAHARQLLQRRQLKQAYAVLTQAAAACDPQAAAFLGDLRLSGQIIRRDLEEARRWFGRAAELGLTEVTPVFIALLANGAGGSGRRWQEALRLLREEGAGNTWAGRQHTLLADMALDDNGDPLLPVARKALRLEPPMETISAFLSADECRYLIDRSERLMQPATVVDPGSGRLVRDPIRLASAASFPFVHEDPALHAINRRIAAATNTTYEQGEPLQVLRYTPGEEYKLHSDALPPGGPEQRVLTMLVALDVDYVGGETSFPRLGAKWRGQAGDALLFRNIDDAGVPDPRVWHSGMPVNRGTKHLLSKWIRAAPLDLSGPSGRPL